MVQGGKHGFARIFVSLFASVVITAFFVFGFLRPVYAQDSRQTSRSLFSITLDKISSAVSRFRDALVGRTGAPNRASEALAARKAVLVSVLEYLIGEAKQAQESLANLSIDREKEAEAAKILEENIFWFTSMIGGISDARAVSQLQIIADDISQYRDQRHAILIRKISELVVAERQRALVKIARARAGQIKNDLVLFEKSGKSTAELREALAAAQDKIERSSDLVVEVIGILSGIHSPYEEQGYRSVVEETHKVLSQSSTLLREAYKIFISMADAI